MDLAATFQFMSNEREISLTLLIRSNRSSTIGLQGFDLYLGQHGWSFLSELF